MNTNLSKFEWFAGMALQGLISKYTINGPDDQKTLAAMAFELAEAMLNEQSRSATWTVIEDSFFGGEQDT